MEDDVDVNDVDVHLLMIGAQKVLRNFWCTPSGGVTQELCPTVGLVRDRKPTVVIIIIYRFFAAAAKSRCGGRGRPWHQPRVEVSLLKLFGVFRFELVIKIRLDNLTLKLCSGSCRTSWTDHGGEAWQQAYG